MYDSEGNLLKSKDKVLKCESTPKDGKYFPLSLLAYIPTREVNEDVLETGILINPIEVYRILNDYGSSAPEGRVRYGAGGAIYRVHGCVDKKYLVHKGNSRVPAALELGYDYIEGILLDEWTPFAIPQKDGTVMYE